MEIDVFQEGTGTPMRRKTRCSSPLLVTGPSEGPGGGRIPGGRNGNPLQDSCLENPMDRGAWGAAVHGVTKSQTRLKQLSTHLAIRSSVWYNAANSIMNGQTDFILSAGQRQTTVMRCHWELHSSDWSEVAQSCLNLCTPLTAAPQAPPSMGLSRQEYWSGLPVPFSRDLPDPRIELGSPEILYWLSYEGNLPQTLPTYSEL